MPVNVSEITYSDIRPPAVHRVPSINTGTVLRSAIPQNASGHAALGLSDKAGSHDMRGARLVVAIICQRDEQTYQVACMSQVTDFVTADATLRRKWCERHQGPT